jgi:hypothetical protein
MSFEDRLGYKVTRGVQKKASMLEARCIDNHCVIHEKLLKVYFISLNTHKNVCT